MRATFRNWCTTGSWYGFRSGHHRGPHGGMRFLVVGLFAAHVVIAFPQRSGANSDCQGDAASQGLVSAELCAAVDDLDDAVDAIGDLNPPRDSVRDYREAFAAVRAAFERVEDLDDGTYASDIGNFGGKLDEFGIELDSVGGILDLLQLALAFSDLEVASALLGNAIDCNQNFLATPTRAQEPTPTRIPPTPGPCIGDCDGDGVISISELVKGVNIALERAAKDTCPSFDDNDNGNVSISEVVKAVNGALIGCVGD